MRRLLLVTYHFPPAGGVGTLRALRFARYLRNFGWQPTVLCAKPLPDALLDTSLSTALPRSVEVRAVSSLEPGRFADSWEYPGQKIVRNLFRTFDFLLVPDEHVGWIRPAVRSACSLFRQYGGYDAVLTTGPPFSTHLVGLELRQRFKIPWVADFRDDWTGFNHTFRGGDQRRRPAFERRLEEQVLRHASVVVTVNDALRDTIRKRVQGTRVEVIPNGYDPADFHVPPDVRPDNAPFVLCHAGSLYEQRSPARFLDALRRMNVESDLRGRLKVRFLGRVVGPVPDLLAAPDLRDIVYYEGFVPHARSVEVMRNSDALLLIIDQVHLADQIWTGKVFEYIAARRPILALMPSEGSLAGMLREDWEAHEIVAEHDVQGICAALKRLTASRGTTHAPESPVVARFRADQLTGCLSQLLEEVVGFADPVGRQSVHRPKLEPLPKRN